MVEHVDPGFQMDSAYFQRSGIYRSNSICSSSSCPMPKKYPGSNRFRHPSSVAYIHDRVSNLDDKELMFEAYLNFILKGQVGGYLYLAQECWAGREFQRTLANAYLNLQPFKWINLHSCFNFGDSIYYDPVDPFLGHRSQWHLNCTLQPNKNLNLFAEHTISRFHRADSGERVYSQGIWRGNLTYQFTPKLFVRALVQYDNYTKACWGTFWPLSLISRAQ